MAGFALTQHVPWADEEQAWLLASEVGWKMLLLHGLRYEGEGGLWQILLKLLQLLHFSFDGVRWATLAAQGAGMAVLLRCAPFPRAVRLLLPFMFFLLYQDAVVMRPYCLFALLAFLAAALLRSRQPRPFTLAFLLGAMAMLSLHGVVLAAGLALAALFHWRGTPRPQLLLASAMLLCFFAVTACIMAPPQDIDFGAGTNFLKSLHKVETTLGIHLAPPPLPPSSTPMFNLPPMPGLSPAPHAAPAPWHRTAHLGALLTYPLSSSRLLGLLLVGAVLLQAAGARHERAERATLGAAGLLPYLLMLLVFLSVSLQPRHAGTVLTGFLVAAWLTWPARRGLNGWRLSLARGAAALLLLVAIQQIAWSAHAISMERDHPYAPSRMTAAFLRSHGISATGDARPVAGYYYFSIGPLLYFNRNIYFNQPPHRYWLWSTSMRSYSTVQEVLAKRPPFIIVGGSGAGPDSLITSDWEPNPSFEAANGFEDGYPVMRYFEQNGYHRTHQFCGHRWMRATWVSTQCETIFEPVSASLNPR